MFFFHKFTKKITDYRTPTQFRKNEISKYSIVDTFNNDEEVAVFFVKGYNTINTEHRRWDNVTVMDDNTMFLAAHMACYFMNINSGYGVDEETKITLSEWNMIGKMKTNNENNA